MQIGLVSILKRFVFVGTGLFFASSLFVLADVGQLTGLQPIYFGSQRALQTRTGVSLENAPVDGRGNVNSEKFHSWAADFVIPGVFKVLVQQKEGTDEAYRFPDNQPESLGFDHPRLTDVELHRAADIEKLKGVATPAATPFLKD